MGNAKRKVNKAPKNDIIKKPKDKTSTFNIVLVSVAAVIAVAIIVVAVIAVAGGIKEKISAPGDLVSLKSEHYEVTNGMLSYYFYTDYYTQLNQNYYQYYYYGLDTSKSLKNQKYTAGGASTTDTSSSNTTWFDYFLSNTVNNVCSYLIFAEKGYDENIRELTDEDIAGVDKAMAQLQEGADKLGLDLDEYIEFMYGEGVTENDIRKAVEFQKLSMKQYNADYDSLSYTQDECQTAYEAAPTSYQYCDYRSFNIAVKTAEGATEEETTAAQSAAQAEAEKIAASTTELEFVANVYNYLSNQNTTLAEPLSEEEMTQQAKDTLTERSKYSVDTDFGTWAFTEGRAAGETKVIDDGNGGYTVYMMVAPAYRLEYTTKSVRHILLNTNNYDSDDDASLKANEVYKLWEATSKTEADFEKLADEYNEDSASLYKNIMLDQMVDEFENWCYDENRQPGDCEIVKSSYGYHLIYFVGDGEAAWKVEVENALKKDAFQEIFDDYETKYDVSYDTNMFYKLSGMTAYSKTADTTAAETTAAAVTTAADTTSADTTAVDTAADSDTTTADTTSADTTAAVTTAA